jgi:tryptophan-rich sensory protein
MMRALNSLELLYGNNVSVETYNYIAQAEWKQPNLMMDIVWLIVTGIVVNVGAFLMLILCFREKQR